MLCKSVITLPNQTWVRLPVHSTANLLTGFAVKEREAFIAGRQARSPGQLVLKRSELPKGLQGKVFKDRVREGSCGVCEISSWTFFLWVGGEVIGSQHHQPSGSNHSGAYMLVVCIVNFSHLVGFQYPQNGSKDTA